LNFKYVCTHSLLQKVIIWIYPEYGFKQSIYIYVIQEIIISIPFLKNEYS
jgi:hypothetical protein